MAMNVDVLVSTGQDATQNYFDVLITPFLGADFTAFNIRTQTFNIPGSGSPTYERKYKTQKILLTTAEVELEKTLTLNFIVDEFYNEYKKILRWKNAILNTATGIIGQLNLLKAIITVQAYTASEVPIQQWVFEGARPINVGDISFDRNSGEALAVDVTFAFDKLNDQF